MQNDFKVNFIVITFSADAATEVGVNDTSNKYSNQDDILFTSAASHIHYRDAFESWPISFS